jgi:hypothetical protein
LGVDSQLKSTIATLKGVKATLHIYSLQSSHSDSKIIFKEAFDITTQITDQLENRLQELKLEEPQYQEQ